jgi:gas vesicle protein
MEDSKIDKKIDEAADAAKRLVAKVNDSRAAAGELADTALEITQTRLAEAGKKTEHRLTENISKAAHRVQETVTKLANRAEEWADQATARTDAAVRSQQRTLRKRTRRSKAP